MKRLLLTGAGGFAGSHIAEYVAETTDWEIVPVPFIHRGLANLVGPIDYIIHAAALADVKTSLDDPVETIQANVNSTLDILEVARDLKPKVFIQVSTNEVYGPVRGDLHKEWSPIVPGSPYAASKAAQEAIAIAYWRSYKVPAVIVNTQNLFGERQQPNKLIPTCVRSIQAGEVIPIYPGKRFWLHARDFASALVFLIKRETASFTSADLPDRFNIRGSFLWTNQQIAQEVAYVLGQPGRFSWPTGNLRPGWDASYDLDDYKLSNLGWWPSMTMPDAISRTVGWFRGHPEWLAA